MLRQSFTNADRLCYTGGVALNSVTNERIIREVGFKDVFIMPAAEDSGNAIGAAYYALWQLTKKNGRKPLVHDAVGASYSPKRIEQAIKSMPAVRRVRSDDTIERTVDLLCEGKIIAWFQGRSELGPRSLGQRSILCDPRRADAKDVLNARVKHREGFRPFAPVIPLEDVRDWFDLEGSPAESAFMLRVCKFLPAKAPLVPGVVHVDGTGRIQTLTKKANGPLYELVRAFKKRTGVPILLNTSLNVAGEPIVETPEDALWCMLYTGIDHCVLGDQIVTKKASYKSLLDLYPYVKATGVSIDLPVLDGQLRRELSAFAPQELSGSWPPRSHAAAAETKLTSQWLAEGLAQTRIHAETEWGPVVHVMTAAILRVLANCTGALDGKTLAERFPFTLDGHSSQTSYLRILGTLRRASVVGFSEKPLPRSR